VILELFTAVALAYWYTVTAREPYDTPVIIAAPFVMFPGSGHLITETVQYC
jgi:hypothetical protein